MTVSRYAASGRRWGGGGIGRVRLRSVRGAIRRCFVDPLRDSEKDYRAGAAAAISEDESEGDLFASSPVDQPEDGPVTKLYTKSGDDGTTGLFSGARVSKNHPRIEAYGTVDEFNAVLGLCISATRTGERTEVIGTILKQVQSRMFDIGADLATPEGASNEARIVRIGDSHVTEIEGWIDQIDGQNEPLRNFVMPGGSELAARLHLARTMCRRAERLIVGLAHTEPVGEPLLQYINRVSDLLFAMARLSNKVAGIQDTPWIPHGKP